MNMDVVEEEEFVNLPAEIFSTSSNINSNSDGQGQGQAKMEIDDTDGDELLVNPYEIDNIVEIIVKNMKNVSDLKNSRLINNMWNKYASNALSTTSIQAQLKPKLFTCAKNEYNAALKNQLKLLKKSKYRKIFRKFGFECGSKDNQPYFTERNYPLLFEIIDLTNPTDIIFYADDRSKNLNVQLFIEFLHKISQNIVHLKIRLCMSREELVVKEKELPVEFPKLKTLEIEAMDQDTNKFMGLLLKKCHILDKLKVHGFSTWAMESIIDHLVPSLFTPKIAQNLQKLHLRGTAFSAFDFEPDVLINMNLTSLKVDPIDLYPDTVEDFVDFQELESFLTSQSDSLEKFTIHFHFVEHFYDSDDESDEDQLLVLEHQAGISSALDIPLLENLKTLKIKYDSFSFYSRTLKWPVKRINLPELLPILKKIEISYDPRWKMNFVANKPCETVEELVLEKWSKSGMFMLDLAILFPKIKYLKVNFCDNSQEYKMQSNFSFMEDWSLTLNKIEVQFQNNFPGDFNFGELSSLYNLEHLYLHQKMRNQNQIEIQLDFTPLFKLKKLSKLVIENIKISDKILEVIYKKYPKLDYTF